MSGPELEVVGEPLSPEEVAELQALHAEQEAIGEAVRAAISAFSDQYRGLRERELAWWERALAKRGIVRVNDSRSFTARAVDGEQRIVAAKKGGR